MAFPVLVFAISIVRNILEVGKLVGMKVGRYEEVDIFGSYHVSSSSKIQGDFLNWPPLISVPKRKPPISQSQLLFQ